MKDNAAEVKMTGAGTPYARPFGLRPHLAMNCFSYITSIYLFLVPAVHRYLALWRFPRFSITLFYIFFFSFVCYADVAIHPNAGTTSASFLKLGIGARAVSMANSFTAVADDVNAIYWNPAGLAFVKDRQVSLSHNEHFQGIRHDFAGYVRPLKNGGAFGIAMYGLYTEKDIEARSGGAAETSWEIQVSPIDYYFMTYDAALHLSYGRKYDRLLKGLTGGVSLKFIQQTIDNVSAYGAAVDAGAMYKPAGISGFLKDVRFGAVLRNLGYGIKFVEKSYALPADVRLGAYWKKSEKLGVSLDFQQPVDNYLFVSGAAEYSPVKFISIRGGYRYRINGLELGDISGVSAGLGINLSRYHIDYSFTPFGVLGASQRISLVMEFPGTVNEITESLKIPAAPAEAGTSKYAAAASTAAVFAAQTNPPETENLLAPDETFSFTETSATCRIIDINMQGTVLYSIGAAGGPSAISLSGRVKQLKTEELKLEIGVSSAPQKFELREGEKYYESLMFKKSFEQEISPAEVTFGIPKELFPPGSVTSVFFCFAGESGILRDHAEKIGEDSKYLIYKARMGRLIPFAITVK